MLLFGYIYPARALEVAAWLLDELWRSLRCEGKARLHPPANMSPEDVERWTTKVYCADNLLFG